ncbi:MAG TPA: OmpA family protein [Roseomonas sp.]|jgi:outer membrane protein OmpA-like peptidoglycan-associated protein
MTQWLSPRLAVLALPLALTALPAAAQTTRDPLVGRIIDQLTPGSTRGIRVPQQDTTTTPTPGQRHAPPPRTAPIQADTTAPAGTPALSVLVNFASGSATLTPASMRALDPVGQALASQALANYRFRIEGHTDTTGDAAMNQTLSERRAAAVRDYLVQRYGVSATRLEVIGLGETHLLVQTGDQAAEVRNRRVQVLNIGG